MHTERGPGRSWRLDIERLIHRRRRELRRGGSTRWGYATVPTPRRSATFGASLAALLRESRIRQGMTQAQVSARTGGLVSKAALANYETAHRSLRVDVFWLLVRALGEDAAVLLSGAERRSGYGRNAETASALTVDIAAVQASEDPRLAPVQRWFDLRLQSGPGRLPVRTVTLDDGALAALAALMGVSRHECRALLAETGTRPSVAARSSGGVFGGRGERLKPEGRGRSWSSTSRRAPGFPGPDGVPAASARVRQWVGPIGAAPPSLTLLTQYVPRARAVTAFRCLVDRLRSAVERVTRSLIRTGPVHPSDPYLGSACRKQ